MNSSVKVAKDVKIQLNRFDGTNYTRWMDKMIFLLTSLKIYYILNPNLYALPKPQEDESATIKTTRVKREEDEVLCRGHILNTLTSRIYNIFSKLKLPKEIWAALETHYKLEKSGSDRFLALKYFEYKIIDNKPIMDQVHEIQMLISKLSDLDIKVPDSLQVGAVLSKLPPSWNEYRKKMLHYIDNYTFEQFQTHLQIEVQSRMRELQATNSKVNLVTETGLTMTQNNLKVQKKGNKFKKKQNANKKHIVCFHCGNKGHYIKECRFKNFNKKGGSFKVNRELVAMVSNIQIEMITELNMATNVVKTSDWWLDSSATVHVCNNKAWFKTYEELEKPKEVLMGNHNYAKVLGKGTIELYFTSGQKLSLLNVFHVPKSRKNLVSASLLSKKGFKIVLESDKVIVTKSGMFVGKGYSCDGMFKFSINEINVISAYMVESTSLLWHARLGHLNYMYNNI